MHSRGAGPGPRVSQPRASVGRILSRTTSPNTHATRDRDFAVTKKGRHFKTKGPIKSTISGIEEGREIKLSRLNKRWNRDDQGTPGQPSLQQTVTQKPPEQIATPRTQQQINQHGVPPIAEGPSLADSITPPDDQMKRGTPKLNQQGLPGSPVPDGHMQQNRASPVPNGFDPTQMPPGVPPQFYGQMTNSHVMRGPGFHPGYNTQYTPQQMEQLTRNGGRMPTDITEDLDFGPLDGPDVLENFDFDSFLHTEDNGAFGSLGGDFNFGGPDVEASTGDL